MESKDIGGRIKELREQKGLNKNELANLAGVSPTYIYQLEQGLKSPTVQYLEYICFGLGITLEQFFCINTQSNDAVSSLSAKQKELLNVFLKSL